MTLNDILNSAQGGRAVHNMAARFDLSDGEAQAATQAMIPAFSLAFERLAAHPATLGGLLVEMTNGAHAVSYADPDAAAGALSPNALDQVFGSPEAVEKVVQHVAEASGVSPQAVGGMLPVAGSILIGGLSRSMADQGHAGVLDELAGAASSPGGLASALGSSAGGSGALGSLWNSVFGGAHEPADPQAAALVAGLTALSAMFAAGVQASQASQASVAAVASSFQPPSS
jgi:hypothetical protein